MSSMPMPTAEEVDVETLKKSVPEERVPHILDAFRDVDSIIKGEIPIKTGRDFLKELREEE